MSAATVGRITCAYLRWRYGGNVYALKPPLGWSTYFPRPLWYRVLYLFFLWPRWWLENWLFQKYGQPMRHMYNEVEIETL